MFKYRTEIIFFQPNQIKGNFDIGLILVQKQGFVDFSLCSQGRFEASETLL